MFRFCIFIVLMTIIQLVQCAKIWIVKDSWDSGFRGEINIPVKQTTEFGWKLQVKFHKPIERFECWIGKPESPELGESGNQYTYVNFPYNKVYEKGFVIKVEFNGAFIGKTGPKVPPVTVKFQTEIIYSDHFSFNSVPATASTTDIVYILNSLTKATSASPFWVHTDTNEIPTIEAEDVENDNNVGNRNEEGETDEKNKINNRNIEIQNRQKNNEATRGEASMSEENITDEDGSGDIFPQTTFSPGKRPARPTKYPYARAIHKSLLFYEAQRSGALPLDNRIPWRGVSAMNDKGENGEDLSGGYYDAGDHMKFGFPMAFSITTLAWGIIEYWESYQQANELENALKALDWGVDYILKAHVGRYEFYGQVGLGEKDHKYWGRPEDMHMERPAFKITQKNPGSDLAAESSAALSASSIAFERSKMQPYANREYLNTIKAHAEALYDFAIKYQGKYHESIKDAAEFYKSTDYRDEITWSVAWLYRATGKQKYLKEAEGKYQNWGQFMLPIEFIFSWDDKTVGIQLLLSQITTGNTQRSYQDRVLAYCKEIRQKRSRYTPKGLLFMMEWSPLRYAANIALICLMASDQGGKDSIENFNFARKQIHYMLGDTGRSFVIGYGRKYPKRPHHRSSSCPANSCSWKDFSSPNPNPNVLNGALVGGPNKKDQFSDVRKNFESMEVSLDHNSCFQGVVAGLLQRSLIGVSRPPNRSHEPWYSNTITTTANTTTRQLTSTRSSSITSYKSTWTLKYALPIMIRFFATVIP